MNSEIILPVFIIALITITGLIFYCCLYHSGFASTAAPRTSSSTKSGTRFSGFSGGMGAMHDDDGGGGGGGFHISGGGDGGGGGGGGSGD